MRVKRYSLQAEKKSKEPVVFCEEWLGIVEKLLQKKNGTSKWRSKNSISRWWS